MKGLGRGNSRQGICKEATVCSGEGEARVCMGMSNHFGVRSRRLTRRRALALAPLLGLPAVVAAQVPAKLPRVGVIVWEGPETTSRIDEVRKAMETAGYREGLNVAFAWRWAAGSRVRAAEAAAELEALGVDVLFVLTTPVAHAAKDVVRKTPIVFSVADALATGLVSNVTRPGGLMTGVMLFSPELGPKRLEILREAMPNVSRVGFLASSIDPNAATFIRETKAAAERLGIALVSIAVRGPEEFGGVLDTMVNERVQAVILQTLFSATSRQFIEPALARGLPCVGDQPVFAENGALLAFGSDRPHLFERAASQIDRILKGASPGDIPVEGPTTFWLAVNQRTARMLGLILPPSLLIRADEVIE